IAKPKSLEHLADRRQHLDLHQQRGRADGVDVALIELPEPAPRRAVGPPHGLNLIALEKSRQLVLILRDDAGQRHGQIVPEREVGLAAGFVLAAAKDLENQLVALLAVLAEQRVDVLERRRLERLEPVALVDVTDAPNDVLAPADLVRQNVACPAWWFGLL